MLKTGASTREPKKGQDISLSRQAGAGPELCGRWPRRREAKSHHIGGDGKRHELVSPSARAIGICGLENRGKLRWKVVAPLLLAVVRKATVLYTSFFVY